MPSTLLHRKQARGQQQLQQRPASTLNAAAGSSGYSFVPTSGYALSRYSTTRADSMIVAPSSMRIGTCGVPRTQSRMLPMIVL